MLLDSRLLLSEVKNEIIRYTRFWYVSLHYRVQIVLYNTARKGTQMSYYKGFFSSLISRYVTHFPFAAFGSKMQQYLGSKFNAPLNQHFNLFSTLQSITVRHPSLLVKSIIL